MNNDEDCDCDECRPRCEPCVEVRECPICEYYHNSGHKCNVDCKPCTEPQKIVERIVERVEVPVMIEKEPIKEKTKEGPIKEEPKKEPEITFLENPDLLQKLLKFDYVINGKLPDKDVIPIRYNYIMNENNNAKYNDVQKEIDAYNARWNILSPPLFSDYIKIKDENIDNLMKFLAFTKSSQQETNSVVQALSNIFNKQFTYNGFTSSRFGHGRGRKTRGRKINKRRSQNKNKKSKFTKKKSKKQTRKNKKSIKRGT
jgi:hypothetical protein